VTAGGGSGGSSPRASTAGGAGRVVCVVLNPALDITYASERFVAGEANRVDRTHARAGGKAVNVARLLRRAGHDVVVTGLAGGLVGEEIRRDLDEAGLPHCLVRCSAGSRRTVSAFSAADGQTTAYNESGPRIEAAEWAQFADSFGQLVRDARAVVLSGSLPSGLPSDAYRALASVAAAAGAATFVDAHAGPLRAALAARPTLVKPNEHELAEAAGLAKPVSVPAALAAARQLLSEGAQAAVVSLGVRGLLAVLPGTALLATPPAQRGNPVGAGDAALAALVDGHLAELPWPARLRRAAAASAAAVLRPVAGDVSPDDVAELEPLVRIGEL
jgi:tagatose 6-phosphate kinase